MSLNKRGLVSSFLALRNHIVCPWYLIEQSLIEHNGTSSNLIERLSSIAKHNQQYRTHTENWPIDPNRAFRISGLVSGSRPLRENAHAKAISLGATYVDHVQSVHDAPSPLSHQDPPMRCFTCKDRFLLNGIVSAGREAGGGGGGQFW